jgi:hypothetical protein
MTSLHALAENSAHPVIVPTLCGADARRFASDRDSLNPREIAAK